MADEASPTAPEQAARQCEPISSDTSGESKPSPTPTCNDTKASPKLTPAEFRKYNRMAETMNYYHNHFRHTWTMMHTACEENKRPAGYSIRAFINMGLDFCRHITTHHTIEEQYVFPLLAKKMPRFREELDLLTHHKEIHKGIDLMEDYLKRCRSGETELRLNELKEIMDGFGAVLWEHLDEEVKELGAENMSKYWTLEEMMQMPM